MHLIASIDQKNTVESFYSWVSMFVRTLYTVTILINILKQIVVYMYVHGYVNLWAIKGYVQMPRTLVPHEQ